MKEGEISMIDVTEYMGFANYIVNKLYMEYGFLNKRYEKEDLLQIAYMTLIKCAKTNKENVPFKFTTYAGKAIRNNLFYYAKKDKKYNYEIYSLNYEFDNDGKSVVLEEVLRVDDGFEDDVITKVDAKQLLSGLSKEELRMARMYFIEEMTQREVAREIKRSYSFVERRISRIKAKLKKATMSSD
ncbi:sigma-70 family RNA polymerase sigma factor [Clostridium neonatale]|uniref:FliA/WhiG subfamily RNA polymerase sigma-28 subunit n=2 Tax=Clostridium carnis TaxID=1530 RepID=A0ABY6SRK2_9CLOT|nr:FliA/WhiG subfamily RNA polymerase sigma-28 subunit [Clostridium neonatale]VDG71128.1 FliA/WhiG subfamily RNA polymerase sigma-28 subunit [Clostridium carnis]CAI3561348.1 FliA/WhiG subfamily RNA polymerase sigma-28 subunit [Clostridium neonatale]CAI3562643.1 FliA/WhiG subfamily RNA polymerase sigma-28 subunit [Clostridium neonatale]CAI3583593.1 FliA/WhiG subfamily RNA polymerase sigma-28 subunit [Clostridium neonatale]